jgi:ATP-dependent DNA ligase
MANFAELFGEATTGKTKAWSIRVFERDGRGVIETTHGYVDGKKQVNEKVISEGKNIGKKNETTPLQQAINEARAAWTKKKESGYSVRGTGGVVAVAVAGGAGAKAMDEDDESVGSGGRGKGIDEDVPLPMLAHDYNKRGKGFKFPCYVQRKYDGTRCVAMPGKGLFSRNRKRYPHMDHIVAEINKLPDELVLDGELYSDTLTFQEIVGLVKRETLKKGDEEKQYQIKLHVYDIINTSMTYEERMNNLQMLFKRYKFKNLTLVDTMVCDSEDKMKELHAQFVSEGYEGIMLRTTKGFYKNSRSADLLKYKEFFDGEYEVIGYKEGEGLEAGCVLWVCKTPEGRVFNCRPRGSREDRVTLYARGGEFVGKPLTVRYQELTDEGIPRFPVGIAFRDYE